MVARSGVSVCPLTSPTRSYFYHLTPLWVEANCDNRMLQFQANNRRADQVIYTNDYPQVYAKLDALAGPSATKFSL